MATAIISLFCLTTKLTRSCASASVCIVIWKYWLERGHAKIKAACKGLQAAFLMMGIFDMAEVCNALAAAVG